MSITVSDCLKLPALREARVAAGAAGLDRIVSSVSVLEYSGASMLDAGLFIGNELMITAFVTIRDNVEEQCRALRRLSEVGTVALVLYYVGIFVKRLDERVLQTADEIGMALVCMPSDRYDCRYGEVISEVMEAIFRDQMAESYFVSGMLDRIAQLPERHRTIPTVLRMLSDRLRCSLLLIDADMNETGEAAWPMSSSWNYREILREFRRQPERLSQGGFTALEMGERPVRVACETLSPERAEPMHLFVIDAADHIGPAHMQQAAELLQTFLNIWSGEGAERGADALVRAILNDDSALMHRIAMQMHIDMDAVNTIWILKDCAMPEEKELRQINARRVVVAKLFLQQRHRLTLVDRYEDCVVMCIDAGPYAELNEGEAEALLEAFQEPEGQLVLTCFGGLFSTRDARDCYVLLQEYFFAAHNIYPRSQVLDAAKLRFTQSCLKIISRGEAANHMEVLQPLLTADASDDLVDTLAAYLLDADGSMQKTGDCLYLHKNTAKYRINKVKQRLGYDIGKMPEAYALYQAVALNRLMK